MKKILILLLLASCQKNEVKLNQDLVKGKYALDSIKGNYSTEIYDNRYMDFYNDSCTFSTVIDSNTVYATRYLYFWQGDSVLNIGGTQYKVQELTDKKAVLIDNGLIWYLSK